jgi:hypothetical protein
MEVVQRKSQVPSQHAARSAAVASLDQIEESGVLVSFFATAGHGFGRAAQHKAAALLDERPEQVGEAAVAGHVHDGLVEPGIGVQVAQGVAGRYRGIDFRHDSP